MKTKDGAQEVEVAGGKIAGQRTSEKSSAGALSPIRLQDLNLDSSGAFEAADTQARKVRLRFDAVEYTLRAGESGKPVWTLDLVDSNGARVGGMRLGASDGATLATDGRLAVNPSPAPPRSAPADVAPPANPPPSTETATTVVTEDDDTGGGGFFTRTGRTLDRTNETVKRNLRKASSRVQRFFHIGGDSGGESNPPSPQD